VRKEERLQKTLQEAWIGDAVLSLYARSKILLEDGSIESDKFVRMTSNRFLSAIGDASEVEAEIGRIYQREGLAAAFEWMDERLLPQFQRQERNRQKRAGI
jgi:dsRNA-specific ribonuclease